MKIKKLICLILILISVIFSCSKKEDVKNKDVLKPVSVAGIEKRTLNKWIELTGDVSGELEVLVYPEVMEKILDIKVNIGDKVKKGDLLAIINSNTLDEGYLAASASLEAAKINNRNAKSEYQRIKDLYEEGLTSESQLTNIKSAYDASSAQVMQANASLNQTKIAKDKSFIKAPIDGYIWKLNYDKGNMASFQKPLCSITTFDKIKVMAYPFDDQFNEIKVGQKVEVTVSSVKDKVLKGIISYVSPVINPINRTFEIEAGFDNKDLEFRPGMIAKLKIRTQTINDAMTIPFKAIVERKQNNKAAIFILNSDIAQKKEVTLGLAEGDYVQILNDIKASDMLIVSGQHLLRDGEKIKIIKGN
ncbi:MAG: efflux RND transporter periplasmic adaptor subunit [Pseudomonadota bacterium]